MYRIGFITDGDVVSKQCNDIMSLVRKEPGFEVAAIISQQLPTPPLGRLRRLQMLIRERGLRNSVAQMLLTKVYLWERRRIGDVANEVSEAPLDPKGAHRLLVKPMISSSGHVFTYPAEAIAAIKELKLDALVRCGTGILKGDVLSAARKGILSLHHGDNRINRGVPAGFWEVRNREPVTGFIVQQLTEELDGGRVYYRGSIRTKPRYAHNLAILHRVSTVPFAQTLFRLVRDEAVAEGPHIYDRHLHRLPKLRDVLSYLRHRFVSKLILEKNRLARRRQHWGVAYYRGDWRNAVLWRGRKLEAPPGTFIADPFAYERLGQSYIFVEEFNYRRGKGVIAVYSAAGPGPDTRLGICLEEATHLSYPFVFEHAGELYMCPETVGLHQVRLYRCHDFPLRWELEAVLLDGIAAVDTNIFPHQGRWWLLTSVEDELAFEHSLHLFHADNLTGPWQRTKFSPAAVEGAKSRNGGMLSDGAQLFRVSQNARFGEYGNGVTINRIDRLNADEYRETAIQEILPKFFNGLSGTHHFHSCGRLLVYDYKI